MKPSTLIASFFLFLGSFSFWACGPTPPSKAEVREKIIGNFCATSYRLEITDSTYRNIKRTPSVMGTGMVRESCKGKYQLEYRDDAWYIEYAKDESPQAIYNCQRSYPLWTKGDGYVIGTDKVTMKDLFDETDLVKSACLDN